MAVSSTTDYLDDSLLTELFEDPLISQLIDRYSPATSTSSHLSSNGTSNMNRRDWSEYDSGGHFRSQNSSEAPTSTTNSTDLKHLLNAEVVLKTDVFNGKKGTVNSISYDGLATVTIDGGIQIRLPYHGLQLISPQPGNKVIVTSGPLKGLPGTLLSAEGNDGIIMSQVDHKIWVVKLHTLAKVSSSGNPHSHQHQHHHHQSSSQLRLASSSTMYSHQLLSPTSPLTPTTPTSSVNSSSIFVGAGSPVTPTPTRNSTMYTPAMTIGGVSVAPSNPLSSHVPHPSPLSAVPRQTHHSHNTSTPGVSPHSMFSAGDGLKQSVTSHLTFLKTPPTSVNIKNIVGSLGKCDGDGLSTSEWLEYLMKRPSIKREVQPADEEDKDDVKASVVQISLVCPVSQRRMEYPCRGIHCKHLQCFDAEAYINMNKNWRPKMKLKTVNGSYHSSLAIKADSRMKCPVCNKYTPFETLYIDKDLLTMIHSTNVNDVEWSGGAWRTIQKNPQNSATDVIDLTLSDSDDNE